MIGREGWEIYTTNPARPPIPEYWVLRKWCKKRKQKLTVLKYTLSDPNKFFSGFQIHTRVKVMQLFTELEKSLFSVLYMLDKITDKYFITLWGLFCKKYYQPGKGAKDVVDFINQSIGLPSTTTSHCLQSLSVCQKNNIWWQ